MNETTNLNQNKTAYSGVKGAFAHIAARKAFPDNEHIACAGFEEAYNAVVNGKCESAVLPIENSYAGEVGQVIDLILNGGLVIDGIISCKISQNLLGIKGAKINDITKVISHSHALAQCEGYIREHGFEEILAQNTALAAKEVSELNDIHSAAIASKETADLYGLEILEHNINAMHDNTTRFAILRKNYSGSDNGAGRENFIIMFTVNDEPGALAKAIAVISEYGFNMKVLRSRPSHQKAWEYYFYVEANGNIDTDEGKSMLKKLSEVCNLVKIAGKFN